MFLLCYIGHIVGMSVCFEIFPASLCSILFFVIKIRHLTDVRSNLKGAKM